MNKMTETMLMKTFDECVILSIGKAGRTVQLKYETIVNQELADLKHQILAG